MTVRGRGGRRSNAQLEAEALKAERELRYDKAWEEWHKRHPHAKSTGYFISVMLVMFFSAFTAMETFGFC